MSDKLILLVEDSKKVQTFNKRMLERAGFVATLAMTLGQVAEDLRQMVLFLRRWQNGSRHHDRWIYRWRGWGKGRIIF